MRLVTSRNNSPGVLRLGADSGADPYAEALSPSIATKPCCCCARVFFERSKEQNLLCSGTKAVLVRGDTLADAPLLMHNK